MSDYERAAAIALAHTPHCPNDQCATVNAELAAIHPDYAPTQGA